MRVFQVWPKRVKHANGEVLAPSMSLIVTTRFHSPTPFANGMNEVAEAYMRIYRCNIKKLGCSSSDFNYKGLDQ